MMILDTSMASMNTKRLDLGQFYGSSDSHYQHDLSSIHPTKKDFMRKLYQSKKEEQSHNTSIAV
jgi:hypothetical protein